VVCTASLPIQSSLPGLTRQSIGTVDAYGDAVWTTGSSPVVTRNKLHDPKPLSVIIRHDRMIQ